MLYNIVMLHLESLPRTTFFSNPPNSEILDEISDLRSVDVSASTEIGYLLLNRHLIGEAPAVVSVGGFLSDLTTPDRAYEGVNLASLQRPVLMLDLPGHGMSSPHSHKQITDLCIRRSADSQAEPLTEAVQKLLGTQDAIDYFGISHGALMSLIMTEQDPGDRVESVFGIDLPAVKRRFTLGLQAGYIVTDNLIGRRKYISELSGSEHEADYERFKAIFESFGIEAAPSFIKNNSGLFVLNLFASINARPVALDSWAKILRTKTADIHVITASESSVSDSVKINEFIETLPAEHKARSHQNLIEGEDHNIGIVHLMPRAVEWARSAYASR